MRAVQLLGCVAVVGGLQLAHPPCPARTTTVRCSAADEAQTTTLHNLLTELKPLGPIRAIVVLPGASLQLG